MSCVKSVIRVAAIFAAVVLLSFFVHWWFAETSDPVTGVKRTGAEKFKNMVKVISSPETQLETAFPGENRITVLLLGLDHVPPTPGDPGKIRRCDSVMVATTDFSTKQIRLLSIPRDGWVRHYQDGKEFGYERLAHAYSLGQQYGLKHGEGLEYGGISRSMETVEHLLGINIDHYMVIKFEGMAELVDAVSPEGLLIDVAKDMKYTDKAGGLYIDIKAGEQRLKGKELLGYARFRHDALGDIGRMQRQQQVLKLLLEEMMHPSNAARLPKAASILNQSVNTSLDMAQLTALARSADLYSQDSIRTSTLMSWYNLERGKEIDIPGLTVTEARNGGYHVQGIFEKDVKAAIEFLNNLEPEEKEETQVAAQQDPAAVSNP